jgi:hypothetical protein
MKVIRTFPHDIYNCEKIAEIFPPAFCERVHWDEEHNYNLQWPKEKKYILDDEVPAEVGWRLRDGIPISFNEVILEDVKTDKLIQISADYKKYDEKAYIVTSLGYPIQLGQAHILKLDGAIRFAELNGYESIYITDAKDVTHEDVTLDQAKQALNDIMGAALHAHSHKQELRAMINAAETPEEVYGIKWDLYNSPEEAEEAAAKAAEDAARAEAEAAAQAERDAAAAAEAESSAGTEEPDGEAAEGPVETVDAEFTPADPE